MGCELETTGSGGRRNSPSCRTSDRWRLRRPRQSSADIMSIYSLALVSTRFDRVERSSTGQLYARFACRPTGNPICILLTRGSSTEIDGMTPLSASVYGVESVMGGHV